MDKAAGIGRRLAAMQAFHDAGIRTACFISPIFPGITDIPAIIKRARKHCNQIWLENLNLRGSYKADILAYIQNKYPALMPLYQDIYIQNNRSFWVTLDAEIGKLAAGQGLTYLRDDDTIQRPFDALPVLVNYFYHEEIKRSAKEKRPCPNSPR